MQNERFSMKNEFSVIVVLLVMLMIALTATVALLEVVKIVNDYNRLQQEMEVSTDSESANFYIKV